LPSERRGTGAREPETLYWLGVAHAARGETTEARSCWERSAAAAGARNEQQYYQGAARARLGQSNEAAALFRQLLESGEQRARESGAIDFFASFGEQQSQRIRLAQAHYLQGLGHLGLGQDAPAATELSRVLAIRPDHPGAQFMLERIGRAE